jgi:hypothetical protein
MKRLFPTGPALLLVMGSLGHVFAAAFCPRLLDHDCCLTKTSSGLNPAQSHHHMHSMAMDGITEESMSMDGEDMQDMVTDDADVPPLSNIHDATKLSNSG